MSVGEEIVEFARALIGTQYKYRGRGFAGIDCGGVPIACARVAGVIPEDWDFLDYRAAVEQGAFDPATVEGPNRWPNSDPVALEDAQPGDVAMIMKNFPVVAPHHVGIVDRVDGELCLIHLDRTGTNLVRCDRIDDLAGGTTVDVQRFREPEI